MRALRFVANVASYWILGTGIIAACGVPFTTLPGDLADAANDWIGVQDTRAEGGGDGGTVCDCPAPPERHTYDAACDQVAFLDGANHAMAKQIFAGKTRVDLAEAVRVLTRSKDTGLLDAGLGYEATPRVFVDDGTVTVDCGPITKIALDQVTFIAPF